MGKIQNNTSNSGKNIGGRKNRNNIRYSRGMQLYKDKKYREAIPYLESEIRDNPQDVRTMFMLR